MKIISWNVNGIRAIAKKGFLEWLAKESPEILCLQETKSHQEQLTDALIHPLDYSSFWCSGERKGYSGVGVYTKESPRSVRTTLGKTHLDNEGRTLILEFSRFYLLNIYFPNGGAGNKRVPYKLEFYDQFLKVCQNLATQGKPLILCGDFNTAHTAIDLARPKENEKNTGFLPEEREWITRIINAGFIDTFRHFHAGPDHYTWWDYKTRARQRNVGWRIDYFFISQGFKEDLRDAFILKDVYGSDHCPLGIRITDGK